MEVKVIIINLLLSLRKHCITDATYCRHINCLLLSAFTCLSHRQSDDHHKTGEVGHETRQPHVHGMHCGPEVALDSRHP